MELDYIEVRYNKETIVTALLQTTWLDRIALFLPTSLFQLMEVAVSRRFKPPFHSNQLFLSAKQQRNINERSHSTLPHPGCDVQGYS